MAMWEFAIAVRDEDDLPSGHKRKKEGDIIAVKPHPWEWGRKEVKEYLIVVADGLTKEEVYNLCQPHYEGGVTLSKQQDSKLVEIINKRRYNIPLSIIKSGWLSSMKLASIRDVTKAYQPLKDSKVVVDFSENVSICRDKHTGTFKYSTKKEKSLVK